MVACVKDIGSAALDHLRKVSEEEDLHDQDSWEILSHSKDVDFAFKAYNALLEEFYAVIARDKVTRLLMKHVLPMERKNFANLTPFMPKRPLDANTISFSLVWNYILKYQADLCNVEVDSTRACEFLRKIFEAKKDSKNDNKAVIDNLKAKLTLLLRTDDELEFPHPTDRASKLSQSYFDEEDIEGEDDFDDDNDDNDDNDDDEDDDEEDDDEDENAEGSAIANSIEENAKEDGNEKMDEEIEEGEEDEEGDKGMSAWSDSADEDEDDEDQHQQMVDEQSSLTPALVSVGRIFPGVHCRLTNVEVFIQQAVLAPSERDASNANWLKISTVKRRLKAFVNGNGIPENGAWPPKRNAARSAIENLANCFQGLDWNLGPENILTFDHTSYKESLPRGGDYTKANWLLTCIANAQKTYHDFFLKGEGSGTHEDYEFFDPFKDFKYTGSCAPLKYFLSHRTDHNLAVYKEAAGVQTSCSGCIAPADEFLRMLVVARAPSPCESDFYSFSDSVDIEPSYLNLTET